MKYELNLKEKRRRYLYVQTSRKKTVKLLRTKTPFSYQKHGPARSKYCTIHTYFANFAYIESSPANADKDVMSQYLHIIVNDHTLIFTTPHPQTHDNAKDKE
jgi:hypothetical protein